MTYSEQIPHEIQARLSLYHCKIGEGAIYRTNLLDKDNGINYRDFIKIRADVIINNRIATIGHEAWLLLFYLSCNAVNKEYIKTNVRMINTDLNIKSVEKTLKELHNNKFIFINNTEGNLDKIGKNDILEIIVRYNKDSLFEVEKKAYKALPTQFVRYLILQEGLSSEEFAIYTVLVNYFRWFECKDDIDEETGETIYCYSSYEYAYPTQEQIGKIIGISRNRVHPFVEELVRRKLISFAPSDYLKSTKVENGRNIIKNPNYRYKIELIQRVEYVYFNCINIDDNRPQKTIDFIKKKGFEAIASSDKQKILIDRDYFEFKYDDILSNFKEALKKRDFEYYNKLDNMDYIEGIGNNILGIIDKFNNTSIPKLVKKKERERMHRQKFLNAPSKELNSTDNIKEVNPYDISMW